MTTATNACNFASLPGVPDTVVVGVIPPGELAELGIFEAVPVVKLNWLDERTGCERAHRYLAGQIDGAPGDYDGCYFYSSGRCDMNGRRADPCLFHEPENGRGWQKVRGWALLEFPDGHIEVTFADGAAEIAGEVGAVVVGAEVIYGR